MQKEQIKETAKDIISKEKAFLITKETPSTWKDLQNKVGKILEECGFSVEIEKKILSVRGTVEIDVYAEEKINGREYSIICECKYWRSNIPQTIIHAFRTVINDLGSNIGYIITMSSYQSGSIKASKQTNIELLTWEELQIKFFESWYMKYFYPKLNRELRLNTDYSIVSWFDDLDKDDRKKYNYIKSLLTDINEVISYFPTPSLKEIKPDDFMIPALPIQGNLFNMDEYGGSLPKDILNEDGYSEFIEKFTDFGKGVIGEFKKLEEKYK